MIVIALRAASIYYRSADHSRTQPQRESRNSAEEPPLTASEFAEAAEVTATEKDRAKAAVLYRIAALKADEEGRSAKAKEYRLKAVELEK